MKIVNKHNIPNQICKNCKSIIEIDYKDLKWENNILKHRKNRWKCPLCKEYDNFINVGDN